MPGLERRSRREDRRNRGTLVNALLHHFATLSAVGGDLRPGIVHRLDKETSGLIVVAKSDEAHRKLAEQFAKREVKKNYIALVHGWPRKDRGTISAAISRDRIRRIRMTTRGTGGRDAVSHYTVIRRIDTAFGKFALVEVKIDTGRTHQIRVHMSSLGHPIAGDALYGAPKEMRARRGRSTDRGQGAFPAAKLSPRRPARTHASPHRRAHLTAEPATARTAGISGEDRERICSVAVERRKNTAHGASRGWTAEDQQALKGRKSSI